MAVLFLCVLLFSLLRNLEGFSQCSSVHTMMHGRGTGSGTDAGKRLSQVCIDMIVGSVSCGQLLYRRKLTGWMRDGKMVRITLPEDEALQLEHRMACLKQYKQENPGTVRVMKNRQKKA